MSKLKLESILKETDYLDIFSTHLINGDEIPIKFYIKDRFFISKKYHKIIKY